MEDTFLPYSNDEGMSLVKREIVEIVFPKFFIVLFGYELEAKGGVHRS